MLHTEEDTYLTVSDLSPASEFKIKGSRFISHIFQVWNAQESEKMIATICKKYHNAAHNCYAYRISDNEYRYSDNGEPAGTAGHPIYQVICGRNLFHVLLIVTRYFGGTKLGTGGLRKAYATAARSALDKVKIIRKIRYIEINLSTNYEHLSDILHVVKIHEGKIKKSNYTEKIELNIQIPISKFTAFQNEINNRLQSGINIMKQ